MIRDDTKHIIDLVAWGCAIVAGISLVNLAYVATALAGFASFALAIIRAYDRFRYGPPR